MAKSLYLVMIFNFWTSIAERCSRCLNLENFPINRKIQRAKLSQILYEKREFESIRLSIKIWVDFTLWENSIYFPGNEKISQIMGKSKTFSVISQERSIFLHWKKKIIITNFLPVNFNNPIVKNNTKILKKFEFYLKFWNFIT